jgi:hypothetical protein
MTVASEESVLTCECWLELLVLFVVHHHHHHAIIECKAEYYLSSVVFHSCQVIAAKKVIILGTGNRLWSFLVL